MATFTDEELEDWQPEQEPGEPGEPGQPGQGQPGQGGEPGNEPPPPGQGQPGNEPPPPGQGQPGNEPGEPGSTPPEDEPSGEGQGRSMDDLVSDLEKIMGERGDTKEGDNPGAGLNGAAKPGKGGTNAPIARVEKELRPVFSWKTLMQQFISSQSEPETTYKKISRGAVTGVVSADEFGAGAVKPGERTTEEAFKLLFVFDSSGSMGGTIAIALAEASNLIAANFDNVDAALGVTFFASSPEYFAANLAEKKFWRIPTFKELDKMKTPATKFPLDGLFKLKISGMTDFSKAITNELSIMASKGYNVMFFTDSDIIYGDNWTNFIAFYKAHRANMFLILNNANTYKQVITKLGSKPNTFGHL